MEELAQLRVWHIMFGPFVGIRPVVGIMQPIWGIRSSCESYIFESPNPYHGGNQCQTVWISRLLCVIMACIRRYFSTGLSAFRFIRFRPKYGLFFAGNPASNDIEPLQFGTCDE